MLQLPLYFNVINWALTLNTIHAWPETHAWSDIAGPIYLIYLMAWNNWDDGPECCHPKCMNLKCFE